jgi:hypothetical protein
VHTRQCKYQHGTSTCGCGVAAALLTDRTPEAPPQNPEIFEAGWLALANIMIQLDVAHNSRGGLTCCKRHCCLYCWRSHESCQFDPGADDFLSVQNDRFNLLAHPNSASRNVGSFPVPLVSWRVGKRRSGSDSRTRVCQILLYANTSPRRSKSAPIA